VTKLRTATLLSLVEAYFRSYLVQARGASAHTLRAYRDTLRLLFKFLAEHRDCQVASLILDDLHVDAILAFLSHLETKRANSVASRNIRLAAIRSFFRHLVEHDLTRAGQYQLFGGSTELHRPQLRQLQLHLLDQHIAGVQLRRQALHQILSSTQQLLQVLDIVRERVCARHAPI